MPKTDDQTVLNITGMTCGHCRAAVESAIREVPGVQAVHVDLEQAKATVQGAVDIGSLLSAVDEAGYQATPAESE